MDARRFAAEYSILEYCHPKSAIGAAFACTNRIKVWTIRINYRHGIRSVSDGGRISYHNEKKQLIGIWTNARWRSCRNAYYSCLVWMWMGLNGRLFVSFTRWPINIYITTLWNEWMGSTSYWNIFIDYWRVVNTQLRKHNHLSNALRILPNPVECQRFVWNCGKYFHFSESFVKRECVLYVFDVNWCYRTSRIHEHVHFCTVGISNTKHIQTTNTIRYPSSAICQFHVTEECSIDVCPDYQ